MSRPWGQRSETAQEQLQLSWLAAWMLRELRQMVVTYGTPGSSCKPYDGSKNLVENAENDPATANTSAFSSSASMHRAPQHHSTITYTNNTDARLPWLRRPTGRRYIDRDCNYPRAYGGFYPVYTVRFPLSIVK